MTKFCGMCGVEKPLNDFHRRADAKDGRGFRCKECSCRAALDWAKRNPERAKASKARWYSENRDAQRVRGTKWRQDNRERFLLRIRRWQDENREAIRENGRRYYLENREELLARKREYRERNIDAVRERERRWYADHPEYYVGKSHQRRALATELEPEDLDYIGVLRADPCAYCGGPAGAIDHIEPLHSGGNGGWENLTASCRSCNSSKRTATLLAFLGRANTQ